MNKPILLASCIAAAFVVYSAYISFAPPSYNLREETQIAAERAARGAHPHHSANHPANHPANHNRAHADAHLNNNVHRNTANFGGVNADAAGTAEPVVVPVPYSTSSQGTGSGSPNS